MYKSSNPNNNTVYSPMYTHQLRPRAVSCPTRMQVPSPQPDTNTVHIAYRPGMTDRGELYLYFRNYLGFELFAFYDHYCFVRFVDPESARRALSIPAPQGVITLEPAQKNYKVPYPQPEEESSRCKVIHVTHLPTNYSKEEMCKVFRSFPGFLKVEFHGKYGYVFFETDQAASKCWRRLRQETNLVVSYAKNAKLDDEDLLSVEREQLMMRNNLNNLQPFYQAGPKLYPPAPIPRFVQKAHEEYSFLNRESIEQLDADIRNDFELLLAESQARLWPRPFDLAPGGPKPPPVRSSPQEEDENTWVNESSFEEEVSFLSDGSPADGHITPGSRTLVNSPSAGSSPETPAIPSNNLLQASWALLKSSSLHPGRVESNHLKMLSYSGLRPGPGFHPNERQGFTWGKAGEETRSKHVPTVGPSLNWNPLHQLSVPDNHRRLPDHLLVGMNRPRAASFSAYHPAHSIMMNGYHDVHRGPVHRRTSQRQIP
ncbi:hypothetical protein SpCBS45565_g02335 [Spizellomyces sp. 'palustris']|nr:hypothetical protein SpCBS45565_g02335 [Spizellomyces sp. 'palustris']